MFNIGNGKKFILFLMFVIMPSVASGYPSNKWKHMDGKHIRVSYNERTEHLAETALDIAEEAAVVIGKYFGRDITRQKIAIVLRDHDDFSNGAAYRYLPLVTIDCRRIEPFFRGETRRLRTIITHELSHIYSLRIMQLPMNLSFGVALSSEDDGSEGFLMANYQHNRLPVWFVEGIAQLGSYILDADFRDPFREMLLRDAYFNDALLSLKQMARFEGTSRDYEMAYNQGFDLMLYLMDTYPAAMDRLCTSIRNEGFKAGTISHFGKSMEDLYDEWITSLGKRYGKKTSHIDGKLMFNLKKRPMATEIRSVDKGKYVITNWLHDYNRFDLMVLDENRRDVERVIKEVGRILKKDQNTGMVWFNREVYNHQTGARNYDIYHFNKQGKVKRVTKGERCLAFDVTSDHLIYAAYDNGTTRIVLQSPDGGFEILKTFYYDTSVYHISMITTDSAILTVGTSGRTTVGILEKENYEMLWPDIEVDVLDCIYAGKDRIMFVSTIDGTSQLYWCNLKKDKYLWYKVTHGAGGIRYPEIDWQPDMPEVSCSVYENSKLLRYRLFHPFSTKHPVTVSHFLNPSISNEMKKDERHSVSQGKETTSNFICSTPSFYFQLESDQESVSDSDVSAVSTSMLTPGGTFQIQNAPNNFQAGMYGEMNLPIGYNTTNENFPSYGIWCGLHLWQLRLKGEYIKDAYISEYDVSGQEGRPDEYMSMKKEITDVKSSVAYQLFKHDYITVSYETEKITGENTYQWKSSDYVYSSTGENSLTIDRGTLYEANIWGIYWEHFSYSSRFDPGNLGEPYFSVNAGVSRIDNEYPGLSYDTTSILSSENNTVNRIQYGIASRSLLFESKLSLKVRVDGFSYAGAIESDKLSPYMYKVVGRESMFSGYSGDIMAVKATRIYGEVRYNPFISIFDQTRWLERMHIGIKLEGGRVEYFDGATETADLISFESTIRYAFYLRPDRLSRVYLKYAIPLKEIDDIEETTSYRVYFGLTIR